MPHEVHILPTNDEEEHDETENCKCSPHKESVTGTVKVFIHQASDGQKYCKVKIDKKWAKMPFTHV